LGERGEGRRREREMPIRPPFRPPLFAVWLSVVTVHVLFLDDLLSLIDIDGFATVHNLKKKI
jgi:hypothetical protein